jgi:hypothetical protein
MTRSPRALPIAMLFVLAACSPAAEATPPDEPTLTSEPTSTETAAPTTSPEATASPESTPDSTPIEGEGGFTFEANAEADALFAETFTCENLDDGYQVAFPAEWNANAEFGRVPPCSWFAPTEYETGAPGTIPDEVAIVVYLHRGPHDFGDATVTDREEGMVGATQPAFRAMVAFRGEIAYEYVVQLGPSLDEGPNLVARTSTEMGGDFALNRAVLDRMMATMEFVGVIQ